MADRIDTAASRYYFRHRIADPAVIDLYAALDEVDRLRAENAALTAENHRLMEAADG